jgi:hypothetical protein
VHAFSGSKLKVKGIQLESREKPLPEQAAGRHGSAITISCPGCWRSSNVQPKVYVEQQV